MFKLDFGCFLSADVSEKTQSHFHDVFYCVDVVVVVTINCPKQAFLGQY